MTQTIQIHSRVGQDGVLSLEVPLGPADANAEVLVTIQPLPRSSQTAEERAEWLRFIDQTAGSWQGEPLQRAPQGEYEDRDPLE